MWKSKKSVGLFGDEGVGQRFVLVTTASEGSYIQSVQHNSKCKTQFSMMQRHATVTITDVRAIIYKQETEKWHLIKWMKLSLRINSKTWWNCIKHCVAKGEVQRKPLSSAQAGVGSQEQLAPKGSLDLRCPAAVLLTGSAVPEPSASLNSPNHHTWMRLQEQDCNSH